MPRRRTRPTATSSSRPVTSRRRSPREQDRRTDSRADERRSCPRRRLTAWPPRRRADDATHAQPDGRHHHEPTAAATSARRADDHGAGRGPAMRAHSASPRRPPERGVAVEVAERGDGPVGRWRSRAGRWRGRRPGPGSPGSATASSVAVRIGLPVALRHLGGRLRRTGRPGARGRRRSARGRGRGRSGPRASAGPGSTGCRGRGTPPRATSGWRGDQLQHLGDRVAGLAAGQVDGVVAAPPGRQLGVDLRPQVVGQRQQLEVAVAR